MLESLIEQIYAPKPERLLYHYTSLQGLLGIVRSKAIWASEVQYLNDAQELKCFVNQISGCIAGKLEANDTASPILRQFQEWLAMRMAYGRMLFTTSFTENGDLLSQWRGYCPPGKGVSIAFEPASLAEAAAKASFLMGRCIYEPSRRSALAEKVLQSVMEQAAGFDPPKDAASHQSPTACS